MNVLQNKWSQSSTQSPYSVGLQARKTTVYPVLLRASCTRFCHQNTQSNASTTVRVAKIAMRGFGTVGIIAGVSGTVLGMGAVGKAICDEPDLGALDTVYIISKGAALIIMSRPVLDFSLYLFRKAAKIG